MLGILESLQSLWKLNLAIGLSFALMALAVLALIAAVRDFRNYILRKDWPLNKKTFLVVYINRAVLALAVLTMAPASFHRLGRGKISPIFAYDLLLISLCLFIVHFLNDELIRLYANGTDNKSAILRCALLGLGALLLIFVGVNVNVRY